MSLFYQKLLTGQNPYHVGIGHGGNFPPHRHPELEMSFCLRGSYCIQIDNKRHTVRPGNLVLIKPTASHEYLANESCDAVFLTIMLGPSFLGEYFSPFTTHEFPVLLPLKDADTEEHRKLYSLLMQTTELNEDITDVSVLELRGNLYQISAMILKHFTTDNPSQSTPKRLLDIAQVEKALEIVYNNYAQPLSIEEVSTACGYSKSNFCKTFKAITGDTFHNLLNNHRIDVAKLHLKEGALSIEGVADAVGFADAKSFCRVFKKVTGISPGNYRKAKKMI